MLSVFKAGFLYYICVFGAGFLFGIPRVLWIAPVIGERYAELAEMPLMFVVIYYSARFVLRRFPNDASHSLAIGSIAFIVLVFSEYFVVWIQGKAFYEYVMARDPVSFGAYLFSLLLYWLMPQILFTTGRYTNILHRP